MIMIHESCRYYLLPDYYLVSYQYSETILSLAKSVIKHIKVADTPVDINRTRLLAAALAKLLPKALEGSPTESLTHPGLALL